MEILVTGAAGFIGYHTVKALLTRGDNVLGLDNINDYYNVDFKYGRLEECGIAKELISENKIVRSNTYSNYSFLKCDIIELSRLEELFAERKFDYVIHLAAQPGVRYSLENPHVYIESNIVGFLNILECCRHNHVNHLVYASSSSVYGMNSKIPFSEDDRVDYPVSLYAATKRSNELMAYTYSHLYQLPTTGLRFFTVYGPWGRPDMAPILFADAISHDKPIKVFNGGEMQRDFTYVSDIVEGILGIAENIPSANNQYPFYRVFNIGNSSPVNLLDFIRTLENEIGKIAKLEMLPMQPGDVPATWADVEKIEKLIHYQPSTDLKSGLREFIVWYKWFYSGKRN